jgi:hypothetical protein
MRFMRSRYYVQVLFQRLFRKVEHVGAEQGLFVLLVVVLTSLQQAVNPRQEVLGSVVRVKHDGYTVRFSHQPHVVRACDTAGNRGLLLLVVEELACVERCAAVR